MNYHLTLTSDERKAIDWIGDRYWHGNDLRDFLDPDYTAKALDWCYSNRDITFIIPEHIAWEIVELYRQNNCQIDCFSPELTTKLILFIESVV